MIFGAAPSRASIDVDVCVIGAGAAGLTVAHELADGPLRVCLLESGGLEPAPAPDPLLELQSTDLVVAPDSRARGLGGTTALWSGKWKHFDSIDFEIRDWVLGSGWPISLPSLTPYYERAARMNHISPCAVSQGFLAGTAIEAVPFRAQPRELRKWGPRFKALLERAANVTTWLHSHVLGLEQMGRRIVAVRLHGGATVRARYFILAAGGIENARLLLVSDVGNEHDQVGRYYMDHPKLKAGHIETYAPLDASVWSALDASLPEWLGFRLAEEIQREERVMNCQVLLEPAFETDLLRRLARRLARPRTCRLLRVRNYLEQEPRPENRVFLTGSKDPYGIPRAGISWSLSALDRRSIRILHRHLAGAVQRARIGELDSPLLHDRAFPDVEDASHHMGTTRMGKEPRNSVVDPNCRVHDIDNLYVTGPSVFPTSGYANPVATISALAMRLCDHLKRQT